MALTSKDDYNQISGKPLVAINQLDAKRRKTLVEPVTGTAFDAYTRMFASFGQGDVFEIGEWRARDIDTMLARDGNAAMLEQALTLMPAQAAYSLQKDPKDAGEYELVQEMLFNQPEAGGFKPGMDTIIAQMAEACIYRKEFFEKHFTLENGIVVMDELAWRPPSTCDIRRDEHTAAFDGFRQRAWWYATMPGKKAKQDKERGIGGKNFTGFLDIPKIRSFVLIHGVKRNPLTGTSDLEVTYWAYKQKQKILFLWFQFLETQSLPRLAVYGADQPQADDAAQTISNMKASAVGGFIRPPQGGKLFDLIEGTGSGYQQFQTALTYLDAYESNSVLAGFLTLASQATMATGGIRGSYALAESAGEFFLKSRQAFVNEMNKEFTRQVIAPICILNFGSQTHVPRLVAEPLSDTNAQYIIQALQALAVSPTLNVPHEYVLLVAEKASELLDLDPGKVNAVLNSAAAQAMARAQDQSAFGASPLGQGAAQIAGATNAASNLLTQNGLPGPNAPSAGPTSRGIEAGAESETF